MGVQKHYVLFVFSLVIVCSIAAWAGPYPVTYTITDLGTLGGTSSHAYGINELGQVTGKSLLADGTAHPFLYSGGVMYDLGTLGGANAYGQGINNHGWVAGYSQIEGSYLYHAFVYRNGTMADLGTLGGDESWATAVNDSGMVTGYSYLYPGFNGYTRAFLYNGTSMQNLGTLPGGFSTSYGKAINSSGMVAGDSDWAGDYQHRAFLYSSGTMYNLGGDGASTNGMNDKGEVTGTSWFGGVPQAFLFDGTNFIDMGSLSYGSGGMDINNRDVIVGYSYTGYQYTAFVYIDGVMYDLNAMIPIGSGWSLFEADGVNDAGQIVGYGMHDGRQVAFLLTPATTTPEPESLLMLGSALATAGFAIRRRLGKVQ